MTNLLKLKGTDLIQQQKLIEKDSIRKLWLIEKDSIRKLWLIKLTKKQLTLKLSKKDKNCIKILRMRSKDYMQKPNY